MVEQLAPLRATGVPRALGMLLLLAGIVAMHAAVFAPAPAEHAVTTAEHSMTATMPATEHGHTHRDSAADTDCDDHGCDGHTAIHGCVFIITAVALALILVLLYRLPLDRQGIGVSKPRRPRRCRERAPPWTVLSLAELSILRI